MAASHEIGLCRPESGSGSSHRLTAIHTCCLLKAFQPLKTTNFNGDLIYFDLLKCTTAHV